MIPATTINLIYFFNCLSLQNYCSRSVTVCFVLQLVLNSMHKYQPRIHIVKRHENSMSAPVTNLEMEEYKTFIYPETIFTAVTAYQNQLVSAVFFSCTLRQRVLQTILREVRKMT